ncbi:methyl-accepting chemotaxis protein [Candidatus Albibeggiatoa sp. nov. BB20]|uniref:methyl-accepting chemotaxis protein n=1 Tax=Candidatus Albibeggiatoa sp. nov. BB20 TaxID=3162723 RepID=UPI0033658FCB
MSLIKNFRIKHKLGLMLFFPLISLLIISSMVVLQKANTKQKMRDLQEIVQLSAKLDEVIQYMQIERDTSAAYLKGQHSLTEVANARQGLDQEIEQFRQAIVNLHFSNEITEQLKVDLQAISQILNQIHPLRESTNAKNIHEYKIIQQYSKISVHLITKINYLANAYVHEEFFKQELAFLNILVAKEKSGIERALLSEVFKQRYFDEGQFKLFIDLVTQEHVYIKSSIERYMTSPQRRFFYQHITEELTLEINKLRELAYMAALDGVIKDTITDQKGKVQPVAEYWEAIQTQKIHALKRVEDKLVQDLLEKTTFAYDAAALEFNLLLSITIIVILFALLLSYSILHNIIYQLNIAVNVANGIAQGSLDNDIKINSKDETGLLLQAFSDMQTQLRDTLEYEISTVLQAASQGDFAGRINVEDKHGVFKTFSININQFLDFNQQIFAEMLQVFASLANGEINKKIEHEYIGTFERLKQDVNTTIEILTNITQEIKKTADDVAYVAEQLAEGNSSFSQRTEEQAASLEETSATMEQMTSTVQQNANNAEHANSLASDARIRAESGGKVVNTAVLAMTEITFSSKKINDITSVIDEIAFQTNLLALNAAVEAARAGDHGRGFAVVASEVRSLAQRSAAAAKEIKSLIQDSNDKILEGQKLVNKSGETLEDIVTSVKKVSDIVAEIAAASKEQSSGIHQVNRAVNQMDEMTQQNAALVEESEVTSEAMMEQAKVLQQRVTFFKISQL